MYAHSSTGGSTPSSPLRPQKEEDCSMHGRSSTEGKYTIILLKEKVMIVKIHNDSSYIFHDHSLGYTTKLNKYR